MADIIPPQRNESWLNPDNTPTLRFAELIEDLVNASNAAATTIAELEVRVAALEAAP